MFLIRACDTQHGRVAGGRTHGATQLNTNTASYDTADHDADSAADGDTDSAADAVADPPANAATDSSG